MGARGPLRGSPIVARRSAPDPLGGRATLMIVLALAYARLIVSSLHPIGVLAVLVAIACFVYMAVAHYSLLVELRKRGVEVAPWQRYSPQLFHLEFEYLKMREAFCSKRLEFMARSAIVAPFVGLALLLAVFVIWPSPR